MAHLFVHMLYKFHELCVCAYYSRLKLCYFNKLYAGIIISILSICRFGVPPKSHIGAAV